MFLSFLSDLRGHGARVVCKDKDTAGKRGSVLEAQALEGRLTWRRLPRRGREDSLGLRIETEELNGESQDLHIAIGTLTATETVRIEGLIVGKTASTRH